MKKGQIQKEITLKHSSDIKQRIDALKILLDKAESKVLHADKFRQNNMNYAVLIFSGLFAAALHWPGSSTILLIGQILTMLLFTAWDRKWHVTKHGWDNISKICYQNIINLTNEPNQDINFSRYNEEEANKAEWDSWQPLFYYFLLLGSLVLLLLSLFSSLFSNMNGNLIQCKCCGG